MLCSFKVRLHPNLSKCEVFWPSGDQSFADFPPAVKRVVLSQTGGVDFLGSLIWGSPEFLSTFVGSVVDRVAVLQTRLRDLEDPQVELLLLCSYLGVCKLNHLLWTIPPGSVESELLRFDDNLRCALSSICNTSISDQSWLQATLPCSLGGLGLRKASRASPAAFLGCCVSSFVLCFQLLSTFSGGPVIAPSIPGEELAVTHLSTLLSGTPVPEVPASRPSGSFNFSLTFVSLIPCCPLVPHLTKIGFMPFFTRLCQCMAQGHSFRFFAWALPCPAGVCVFSLVLAWDSIVYFY